jgi:hypothetical protein
LAAWRAGLLIGGGGKLFRGRGHTLGQFIDLAAEIAQFRLGLFGFLLLRAQFAQVGEGDHRAEKIPPQAFEAAH